MTATESAPDARPLKCVVVTGPTASGKTRLGVALARAFHGEIVSADSRQVYRGMDVGTGKDLSEYSADGAPVRSHLIDVVSPQEEYNLHRFVHDAASALVSIAEAGKLPVVVGGSPLYVNALLRGYRLEGGGVDADLRGRLSGLTDDELAERLSDEAPDVYARTDRTQRPRILRALEIAASRAIARTPAGPPLPPIDALVLAPYYPRAVMHERIRQRLMARLDQGLVDEVRRLHDGGLSWERLDYFGLEYRWVSRHLRGELTHEAMVEKLLIHIRRFCRAQDIWFRKMEREGRCIYWIPGGDYAPAAELVSTFLAGAALPAPTLRLDDIRYGPRSR